MRVNIIGVDCATNPSDVGIALGSFCNGHTTVEAVRLGSHKEQPAEIIAAWLKELNSPALLALDAPLGWPDSLARELPTHIAGRMFTSSAHSLFRRSTDTFIKEKIGKQSLDVGADRIARTAFSALELLERLGQSLDHHIELAWEPRIHDIKAIEVYPAATLMAHRIDTRGYKSKDGKAERLKVSTALKMHLTILTEIPGIEKRSDSVDAVACVLAGQDFLSGLAFPPPKDVPAKKEGWIWVRNPTTNTSDSHQCETERS